MHIAGYEWWYDTTPAREFVKVKCCRRIFRQDAKMNTVTCPTCGAQDSLARLKGEREEAE